MAVPNLKPEADEYVEIHMNGIFLPSSEIISSRKRVLIIDN